MNKDLKKTYEEHRDEQLEIEAEKREALRKALLASLSLNGSLRVKALDLEYVKCLYLLWNGVKGGGNRGFGWSDLSVPSQLVLSVEALGGKLEIRVDRTFKESIGLLTPKRRNFIRQAMPCTVEIVRGVDPRNGDSLILVSSATLATWVNDVKALLASLPSRKKA